jgi:hypothetical protein
VQSQQLAGELQSQQKELQQTNEDIALKAALLKSYILAYHIWYAS